MKDRRWLIIILLFGLILRLIYFSHLTFGYDQARDALEAIGIIKNLDIKIIGPTTDIRGLFHSPLYWYIISPFYFFSGGNPEIARIPMIGISLLSIVFIYFFANELFKNNKIALFSSLLMAVSFEAVQYARWLSNPPPALLTVAVFFYGLWLVLKKRTIGFPLMLLFWSLSVDFQFFLVYQFIFIIFAFFYLVFKQPKIIYQSLLKYYWLYLLSMGFLSFYILAQIKFGFLGVRALLSFVTKHNDTGLSLLPKFNNFILSLIKNLEVNFTGYNHSLASIFLVLLAGYILYWVGNRKKSWQPVLFLSMWLISPILIYPLEKNNSYFLNIGNLYPIIILIVYFLFVVAKKFKKASTLFLIIIISAVVLGNLVLVLKENDRGETLFSIQDTQDLHDEKNIIDRTYRDSRGKMFAFNTLTNPLYMNTTWAYLYEYYGKKKYGYMPVWWGAYLDDYGKEIKFTDINKLKKGDYNYLIVEPPVFHEQYIKAYGQFEDTRSILLEREIIRTHIFEQRKITKIKDFNRDELTGFFPH